MHLFWRVPADTLLPRTPRAYLGMLPPNMVPVVLSTLNIAVICNRESAFGKYCFPRSSAEAVACGVLIVAAATGSMLELLKDRPECLYEPDNVDNLVAVLRRQVTSAVALPLEVPTWSMLGKRLKIFARC